MTMKTIEHIICYLTFTLSLSLFAQSNTSSEGLLLSQSARLQSLSASQFLKLAVTQNPAFKLLMLEEIKNKYDYQNEDMLLNLLLEADSSIYSSDGSPVAATVGLKTELPSTATELGLSYNGEDTSAKFSLQQPLLRNALGKQNRLQKINADLTYEIKNLAVLEDYENLIADMLNLYLDWSEAWYNIENAKTILQEDERIYREVQERRRQNVALEVDEYKALQELLAARRQFISASNQFLRQQMNLKRVIPLNGQVKYMPSGDIFSSILGDILSQEKSSNIMHNFSLEGPSLEKHIESLYLESRSFSIYKATDESFNNKVDLAKSSIFPVLQAAFTAENIGENETSITAGLNFEWAFPDQGSRAIAESTKIEKKQSELQISMASRDLKINLSFLHHSIEQQNIVLNLLKQEVDLAEQILLEERQEYKRGRSSLRELINAVKALNNKQQLLLSEQTRLNRLVIDWLRISDHLVRNKRINDIQ